MNCKLLIWKPAASIPCYDKLISCAENGMNLWQCAKVTNPPLELILWKQTAAELLWTHFIRNFYSCQSYSYKARSVNSHFFIRNLLRQFPCISTVSLCISDKTGFLITYVIRVYYAWYLRWVKMPKPKKPLCFHKTASILPFWLHRQ